MERQFYGPLWPLGYVQPLYRGAGEAFTHELTGDIETTEYMEAAAKGFIISPRRQSGGASVVTTGYIYVVLKGSDGTFSTANAGTTVLAIPPGSGPVQFPQAEYGSNKYKLDELGIDVDVDGDGADVCAIMQ